VHGIPGRRVLHDGDIVAVDVGVFVNGFHGDSAWTYPVGRVSLEASDLLRATEEALEAAIAAVQPGSGSAPSAARSRSTPPTAATA
jgi:methionyl aminopeptidase